MDQDHSDQQASFHIGHHSNHQFPPPTQPHDQPVSPPAHLLQQHGVVSEVNSLPTVVVNIHPMVTRTKDGTQKPKVLSTIRHPLSVALSVVKTLPEPTCFSMAVQSPEWRKAMALEFDSVQHGP